MSPIPPCDPCLCGGGGCDCSNNFDVLANQPPAGDVEPGTIFFATDTGDTYISDGVTWYLVSSGNQCAYWFPITTHVANHAVVITNRTMIANAAALTFTLPDISTTLCDTIFVFKDNGFATATPHTITPFGTNTIDGFASYPISQDRDSLTLAPNAAATNWMVI